MKKYIISIAFIFALVCIASMQLNVLSAQDIDGVATTVTYPDPIPAGTTYNQVFPDDNFATCIASGDRKSPNDPIVLNVFNNSALICRDQGIEDLTGIQYFTAIDYLDLNNNAISDVSPIASLTNLNYLELSNNNISDITTLSGLNNLTSLYLKNNQISDLSALSSLNLVNLDLDDNQISDISSLSSITTLKDLSADNNQISDISSLSSLVNLEYLHMKNNQIVDISSLAGLTNLKGLVLDNNEISDITALSNLANLEHLSLNENHIADITPISSLSVLSQVNDQTIDLGTIYGSTLSGPIQSYDEKQTIFISQAVSYQFTLDETYASPTNLITLNSNFTTPFTFSAGRNYNGTITFSRADAPPTITQPGDVTISENDTLDILAGVSATDLEDGDLTSVIITDNPDGFKGDGTDVPGSYTITYTVTDSFGNTVTETRVITVIADVVAPIVEPTVEPTVDPVVSTSQNTVAETGVTNVILVSALLLTTIIGYTVSLRLKF